MSDHRHGEWAKVFRGGKDFEGRWVVIIPGQIRIADYSDRGAANQKRNKVNKAISKSFSPLLARAELLEKAIEALKQAIAYSDGDHQPEQGFWEDILTAYASLPKMLEGGGS